MDSKVIGRMTETLKHRGPDDGGIYISVYLPYLTVASCHTTDPIGKVYADKGYQGEPNSGFLRLNGIKDGIMRKDYKKAKLTNLEIKKYQRGGISLSNILGCAICMMVPALSR